MERLRTAGGGLPEPDGGVRAEPKGEFRDKICRARRLLFEPPVLLFEVAQAAERLDSLVHSEIETDYSRRVSAEAGGELPASARTLMGGGWPPEHAALETAFDDLCDSFYSALELSPRPDSPFTLWHLTRAVEYIFTKCADSDNRDESEFWVHQLGERVRCLEEAVLRFRQLVIALRAACIGPAGARPPAPTTANCERPSKDEAPSQLLAAKGPDLGDASPVPAGKKGGAVAQIRHELNMIDARRGGREVDRD